MGASVEVPAKVPSSEPPQASAAPTPATSLGVWGITGTGPDNPDKLFIGGDFTGLKQYPSWRFGQYAVPGGS